ncbi:unnamed protein product [Effrenium voratum]|nr:unnamed protein product [Effrenium voratum]
MGAAISQQILELQGEEQTATARSQELEREVKSLDQSYKRYRDLCYTYGAAILRTPDGFLGAKSEDSKRRGIEALVEVLANRFGWPEVAFLRLDRRGAGRLGAQELRMGLLLGAKVDFPAVTGLTAEALLAAIDRRGAGFITASDLAACRPELWKSCGARPPELEEKFRALPWLAAGGATQAYHDATSSARSLKWADFEGLVCGHLRVPKSEAQEVFAKISEKDLSGELTVSPAAWERATKEPTCED